MNDRDKDIATIVALGKKYMWAGAEVHKKIQEGGVILEPARFYSSVPTISEIESSFENVENPPPYFRSEFYDDRKMQTRLAELVELTAEFDPPNDGDPDRGEFFWDNRAFSWLDAMVYYAMLRKHRPRRIIEIGSGFSTLVARQAVAANGCGKITCVEPFPYPWLESLDDIELVKSPAQDLDAAWFNERLGDGDLLFIDSTHTVKAGSDCCHLYLRVLPRLTARLLVHVHDIFLPYGLPENWLKDLHIHWTEQYLLEAYLLDNPGIDFILGTYYASRVLKKDAERLMHGRAPARGQSFWFWRNLVDSNTGTNHD